MSEDVHWLKMRVATATGISISDNDRAQNIIDRLDAARSEGYRAGRIEQARRDAERAAEEALFFYGESAPHEIAKMLRAEADKLERGEG